MDEKTLVSPVERLKIEKCFLSTRTGNDCFLKGCKWSPDGKCLLTASDDNCVRLFEPLNSEIETTENPVLTYKEGGTIYDYAWYPSMSSTDPQTCVFATASHSSPVHLWDAWTGELRATYRPINQFDEVTCAYSLCFSPNGKLYCGLKKEVRVFTINLPGRESEKRAFKSVDEPAYQTGIASAIAVNPLMPHLYAVGSYDKSIGLYAEPDGSMLCLLQAHRRGVSHLLFGPDGNKLFSGGRKDSEILCWDLRNPGTLLFTAERVVETQQRIYFDVSTCGRYLISGSTNGNVLIFDTNAPPTEEHYLKPVKTFQAHEDCTNGISLNPLSPLLATASGQRHTSSPSFSDDEDCNISEEDETTIENSVKIWTLPSWMLPEEKPPEMEEKCD